MSASVSSSTPRQLLWLCLYFSRLALAIVADKNIAQPLAIIEQRRVHCANRENLPEGMSLTTALALHPDLLTLERNREREDDHLQQLAHWAYQFTPGVVIADNNSLLLEIGSCIRLYRSPQQLLKQLHAALRQRGQFAHFGMARTPAAAWLLAQCAHKPALVGADIDEPLLRQQITALPVAALAIDSESQRSLMHMGLTTLGDIFKLPNAALGKRFGAEFIDYLQKINGTLPDPQKFFTPAPIFQHGLTFIDGIAQRDMLLFPMKRLLQILDDYLRARQVHAHTLHWQIFDARQLQCEFSIKSSCVQNRWQNFLELTRLKLEKITLRDPIFSLQLRCENFFEAAPVAQQLFPDTNDNREAAAALIDRLRARLGKDALQHLAVRESHWPELSWAYSDNKTQHRMHTSPKSIRPLWLLTTPQPLALRNQQPIWQTPLVLLRGPERIDNHWWHTPASERDYYIARNNRDILCWIYCERATQQWFLHGLFS